MITVSVVIACVNICLITLVKVPFGQLVIIVALVRALLIRSNVTKEAKAIFRAIMGTDERYGASMITSIVRGERTDRIMRAGHDALPVFGLLSNVDEKSIKGLIQQFVASGYLRSSTGKYPVLSLTAGAEEVLAGHKEVEEIRQHVSVPSRNSKSAASVVRGKSSSTSGGLFEHLRQHRKRLAEKAGLRPYLYLP